MALRRKFKPEAGIRRNTIPLIYEAVADFIVLNSLMFNNDPLPMRGWRASL